MFSFHSARAMNCDVGRHTHLWSYDLVHNAGTVHHFIFKLTLVSYDKMSRMHVGEPAEYDPRHLNDSCNRWCPACDLYLRFDVPRPL
uniref:Uncharacterized protein n=1 Tax=Pararge aegeria TaxID=116150 RepID=S4NS26_9NEOP